ncbi:hypothetical protein [Streptomyces sp. NPDC020141]|uniref:hypothetical protein n=1 Tax=Streptomyces sp. NPDC020141 TaxID=3365065 RepID=UPI0037AD6D33
MHMKSAPHLLHEDRAEYERILDEALRNAHDRPDLAAVGRRLNPTQLRTMALNATSLIAGAAAAEYEHYTAIREETRSPSSPAAPRAAATSEGGTPGSGTADGGTAESGAGLTAVITVLAPVLAGTAALIFLLVGHLLKALDPAPSIATPLVTAGWFFAAATAAAILFAAAALLRTALGNAATEVPAEEPAEGFPDEVDRAKEAWLHALLERGILPFLRAALSDPDADPTSLDPPGAPEGPGPDPAGGAPPDRGAAFTSPDFGGPRPGPER